MKHVTLAVTLDASGNMLPPMLIFKGVLNGQIAKCKLQLTLIVAIICVSPIDVGINKSIKNRMRDKWEVCMIE